MSITGTNASETINGTSGDDIIYGLFGNDIINGGDGADTLVGGPGNDQLTGGTGNDIFLVEDHGFGDDTIVDFTTGDRIDLSALGIGDLGTLSPFMFQNGDDTIIRFFYSGGYESLTLTGVDVTTLTAASFIFNASATSLTQTGTNNDDTLFGGNANDTLIGNFGDDLLVGGKGNDTLIGGPGNDSLVGGEGNDVFKIAAHGFGADIINDFNTGDRIDLSDLGIGDFDTLTTVGFMYQDGFDAVVRFFYSGGYESITLTGVDVSTLTNASFIFNTSATALTQTGTNNDDVLFGGSANDTLTGNFGDDLLMGGKGNDTLIGGSGADRLFGGAGNDIFKVTTQGFGNDTVYDFTPGDRIDLSALGIADFSAISPFIHQNGADTVIELYYSGGYETITLTGIYASSITASSFIFNLSSIGLTQSGTNNDDVLFGGNGSDTINGNFGDDILWGGKGNDILNGGGGNDTLLGGTGNNTVTGGADKDDFVITDNGKTIITDFMTGDVIDLSAYGLSGFTALQSHLVQSGTDTVITLSTSDGSQIIKLNNVTASQLAPTDFIFSTATGVTKSGTTANDTLQGSDYNDSLNGGAGADSMTGLSGNDKYYVDNTGDIVVEAADAGNDTVSSTINYTLGANVENLTLTGTADINATGNTLDNILTGNSGNNTINGGGGVDIMIGGLGDDVYYVDDTGDLIAETLSSGTDRVVSSVSYALSANVENLTLSGITNVNGTGNTLANTLIGNANNNTLNGGGGADTMNGGDGNDTYIVDNAGDVVIEGATGGSDTIYATMSYSLTGKYVESLFLMGTDNINASGNGGDNLIVGNSGNNVINGGAGNDTMNGGAGDDIYYVDSSLDVVVEGDGGGTDTIYSAISYSLGGRYVEKLFLTGTANINATGNAGDNLLVGNDGNNTINGGAGADSMNGGNGNDTYYVDNALDVVVEGSGGGTDTVISTISYSLSGSYVENLTLTGNANINTTGNGLANTLIGNTGSNTLNGGSGNDILIGGGGNDIFYFGAGSGADTVTDFSSDTLNLHAYSLGVTNGGGITITQVGSDTVVNLGGGNMITLTGIAPAALTGHIVW
jgi:Ca2+-binding RTX toxin-like protein